MRIWAHPQAIGTPGGGFSPCPPSKEREKQGERGERTRPSMSPWPSGAKISLSFSWETDIRSRHCVICELKAERKLRTCFLTERIMGPDAPSDPSKLPAQKIGADYRSRRREGRDPIVGAADLNSDLGGPQTHTRPEWLGLSSRKMSHRVIPGGKTAMDFLLTCRRFITTLNFSLVTNFM